MLTERTTTLFVSIFYFQKCQTREYISKRENCQGYYNLYSRIFRYNVARLIPNSDAALSVLSVLRTSFCTSCKAFRIVSFSNAAKFKREFDT